MSFLKPCLRSLSPCCCMWRSIRSSHHLMSLALVDGLVGVESELSLLMSVSTNSLLTLLSVRRLLNRNLPGLEGGQLCQRLQEYQEQWRGKDFALPVEPWLHFQREAFCLKGHLRLSGSLDEPQDMDHHLIGCSLQSFIERTRRRWGARARPEPRTA